MIVVVLLMLVCFVVVASALTPGVQRAVDLLKQPLPDTKPVRDIILSGNVDRLENAAYLLTRLRMRIGEAWENVLTDFGFVKQRSGLDLVNHQRKIAIELKNSYRTDSSGARKWTHEVLKRYKREHPQYTVVYGTINYKSDDGKIQNKDDITYLYGNKFLDYILQDRKDEVIATLRNAVRRVAN
jgi:hypothetical protein